MSVMLRYIMKRLLQFIPIIFIVSIIIFGMVRIPKIDPVAVIVGGGQASQEEINSIREKYNLNKPMVIQYYIWITGALRGDFGLSINYEQPITSLIKERLPVTLGLTLLGTLFSILIAIPVGVVTAVKKNTWVDRFLSIIILVLVSCPVYLTCILMILVISAFFPSFSFTGTFTNFSEYIQRIILPAIALAFGMIALLARVTRSSMIEQLQSNYIMTANAKGLPFKDVIFKHALKNAAVPIITICSIQIGVMMVGSVLVERVFSLSGIGSLLIDGINNSDYPIVQGVTLLLVTVFLLLNLIADIIYAFIDPRIRYK